MEQSDQNQIKQEVEIIEQANNATLKKIAFYFLSPVLIPLALASTAFVCMSSVLRFVFVDPFREAFSNDLNLNGVMNLLRVFVLMAYTCISLICAPFYLLGQILASPVLVFAWIKSAFVGFARLADFIFSDKKEILASNRLDEIAKPQSNEDISEDNENCTRRYDGTDVKSGSKAMFGYMFGIYDFDVKRSLCSVWSDPNAPKPAPKIEARCFGLEGFRVAGRKWM